MWGKRKKYKYNGHKVCENRRQQRQLLRHPEPIYRTVYLLYKTASRSPATEAYTIARTKL